jgi:hypothetical protein
MIDIRAIAIFHLANLYKVSKELVLHVQNINRNIRLVALLNWGPWAGALKALALIWH